jgi:acetyl-CoA acyltransferase
MQASRSIETGDASVVVAGGAESMTRAPWVLSKPAKGFPAGDLAAVSSTLGWRLVNPAMPAEWTVSLGEANEQLGEQFAVDRARQDDFALRSQRLAAKAWEEGFYDGHVVPVPGSDMARDEGIRPDATAHGLAALRPAFRDDGTITAGNASPLSDGASAILLGDEAAAASLGRDPLARIVSRAAVGCLPQRFGYAPVDAANLALKRAGLSWEDVDAVELNEAFAVQSLVCMDAWGVDPDLVNTRGGAIALGHPLGASGGRILATLVHVLGERGGRYGVAAICIGVGQGLALVVERP